MGKYTDKRYFKVSCNTIEMAVKTDSELLRISKSVRNKSIYCHEFKVSEDSLGSLKRNNNCVIGTGVDATLLVS